MGQNQQTRYVHVLSFLDIASESRKFIKKSCSIQVPDNQRLGKTIFLLILY